MEERHSSSPPLPPTGADPNDPTAQAKQTCNLTPAGAKIRTEWVDRDAAIRGLEEFLGQIPPLKNKKCHVVFRGGTVVRVDDSDPEFSGFEPHTYRFPEHRAPNKEFIAECMHDNELVWCRQKNLPGDVGKVVRQGFARALAPGYPLPGCDISDRTCVPTLVKRGDERLWLVFWPALDRTLLVFNLVFAKAHANGVALAGELRRFDFMFPEVAAVFMSERERWGYDSTGVFCRTEHASAAVDNE